MSYDGIVIGDLFSEEYYGKHLALSKAFNVLYSTRLRTDLKAQDLNVKNIGIEDTSNVYEVIESSIAIQNSSTVQDKAFKNNEIFNFSFIGVIINSLAGVGSVAKGVLGIKNISNKAMYIADLTYHAKLKNGNTKDGISAVSYVGLFGNFTNNGALTQSPTFIKRGATVEYDLTQDLDTFITNDNDIIASLAIGSQQVNFNSTNQSVSAEGSIPEKVLLGRPILVKPGTTIGVLATNTTVFGSGVDIQASININGFFANETDF